MTKQEFLEKHDPFSPYVEYQICREAYDWINSLPEDLTLQQIYDLCEYPSWLIWYVEHYYDNCQSIIMKMVCRLIRETPVGEKTLLDLIPEKIVSIFNNAEKPESYNSLYYEASRELDIFRKKFHDEVGPVELGSKEYNKKMSVVWSSYCVMSLLNNSFHMASIVNYYSMLAIVSVDKSFIDNARKVQCKIIRECFPEVF